MRTLPFYTAEAIRRIEYVAGADHGLPPYTLMQRAANASLATIRRHFPSARRLHVVAGPGNNGGDGIELARQAISAGHAVELVSPVDPAAWRDAAATAWAAWQGQGRGVDRATLGTVRPGDVVVDALFGTGLNRAPAAPYDALIAAINAARAPCVALDAPSGLDTDSGVAPAACVRALHTVTFIARKPGLAVGAGPDLVGRLTLAELGVPPVAFAGIAPCAEGLPRQPTVVLRGRRAHKGDHGRVLIVGGHAGMRGAVVLAGEAAQRAGAGLVRILTPATGQSALPRCAPELMVDSFADAAELDAQIEWADVVAIGPGLGRDAGAAAALDRVLASGVAAVVDADALTLLAARPRPVPQAVLTPHPGEAARLSATTAAAIEQRRLDALAELVARYDATVVLKGARTLIGAPGALPALAPGGNPGMATGGSGDVLTGIVAALRAAGRCALEAAQLAVTVHNAAADRAAGPAERGLSPRDVIAELRACVN